MSVSYGLHGRPMLAANGLPLAAVGDFERLNCQLSTNVDRCTALQLTTSAPIVANGCWLLVFYILFSSRSFFRLATFNLLLRSKYFMSAKLSIISCL
jgi:hypothetical protein